MRSLAVIFLLVLLTITQTPVGQMIKLPVLIGHFNKHKKQDKISFAEFLNDHYNTEHKDADQAEDEQLPFKNGILYNSGVAIVPDILISNFYIGTEMPAKLILPDLYIPQQHLCNIFHPPQV